MQVAFEALSEVQRVHKEVKLASFAVNGVDGVLYGHALHKELEDVRLVPLGVDVGHGGGVVLWVHPR